MSCEIKNEECPFQIQCLFPTTATDRRPFALYFYSSQGSQERVLACAYTGHPKCFHENGFEITHEGFNDVTITVPDTLATSKGSFGCQKGDIPMVKNCLYNPPEICNTISSTESGIGLKTTTKDVSPTVLAGVTVGSIVLIALIIIIIVIIIKLCLLLFKKYRPKTLFRFTVPPPVIASDENNKPCLEKENTDNHVNQTTTDSASSSVNGGNMGTKDLIHGDDEVANAQTANADQEHTSTDNRDAPGRQSSPTSAFNSTTSSDSDKPLL